MADPVVQNITSTTSNLPDYAKPYFENLLQRGQANSYQGYTAYPNQRIADFTPGQTYAQQQAYDLQQPGQFGAASGLAALAGSKASAPSSFSPNSYSFGSVAAPSVQDYSMAAPQNVDATGMAQASPQMGTSRTDYNPNLRNYNIDPAATFGQPEADRYMSPFMQSVVDATKREAITDAQKTQLMTNLGAARQGTYGGARQLLAGTERERALGQNLSDIQTKGLQAAYENAQQQFERDRNAGFSVNKANLDSNLQTQQLGANIGVQTALANLTAEQQAKVQNLAAQLQTQGLNADQALKMALANQQTAFNVGKANLDANLTSQNLRATTGLQALLAELDAKKAAAQLSEQSRQFGGTMDMDRIAKILESSKTLGNLGTSQQTSDLQRIQAQAAAGAEQQALDQRYLDTDYADFLRQRDYPTEQLNYYSSLLRGLPITPNSTATTYAPPPSVASQVGGLGLGALSLYNLSK
jgi:hypothetical protein